MNLIIGLFCDNIATVFEFSDEDIIRLHCQMVWFYILFYNNHVPIILIQVIAKDSTSITVFVYGPVDDAVFVEQVKKCFWILHMLNLQFHCAEI